MAERNSHRQFEFLHLWKSSKFKYYPDGVLHILSLKDPFFVCVFLTYLTIRVSCTWGKNETITKVTWGSPLRLLVHFTKFISTSCSLPQGYYSGIKSPQVMRHLHCTQKRLTFSFGQPGSCFSSEQTCQTPPPPLQDRGLTHWVTTEWKTEEKTSSFILISKFSWHHKLFIKPQSSTKEYSSIFIPECHYWWSMEIPSYLFLPADYSSH